VGMPEIHVELTFSNVSQAEWHPRRDDVFRADMKVFTDGVRQFAATNGLHAC
jgi:hypothetical protein